MKRYLVSLLIPLALLMASVAGADVKTHAFTLTPYIGGTTFDGVQDLRTAGTFGLRAGYELSPVWAAEASVDYAAPDILHPVTTDTGTKVFNYRLEVLYNFMADKKLVPFIAAGVGGNHESYASVAGDNKNNLSFDYGAGIKYFITNDIALRGDIRHMMTFGRYETYQNLLYNVGLSFYFGGVKPAAKAAEPPRDSDGDGVIDAQDECPGTPAGVSVDSYGCPIDSDKDGVPDYLDKCPGTPAGTKVDKDGCPLAVKAAPVAKADADKDGVPDDLDKCPGTPAGVWVDAQGCPVDSDKDGVPDYLDKCPLTPAGAKVDAKGCPIDSDKDGVADYLDKCPNTPAGVKVDDAGCPIDSDGDGVPDYLDKCPGTAPGVSVDAKGCPLPEMIVEKKQAQAAAVVAVDSDKDGVPDNLDKCPRTPAGVKVDKDGCPLDSDKDGVPDYQDECPNTPADVKVDKFGCPVDSDGDGVPDYLDKCPNTPRGAKVDAQGCPAKKSFRLAIEFDTGKAVVRPRYNKQLKEAADFLKTNPATSAVIEGHTDNVGGADMNMKLSIRRAEAVKAYIVKNFGVKAERISTKGLGLTKPVATNANAAGRQKNRRIEIDIFD
ncbi:MAG: OmpA family protein [Smithellaceae bacterium]|nr:OmpA family protein [Smithellaceae bacterium]